MVLTVYSALSLVTGLVCHHRRRKFAFRRLDASVGASGPHGLAVRKISAFVNALLASTASRSNVRDDRETPLCVGRDGATMKVIWVKSERDYFCKRGWTTPQISRAQGERVDAIYCDARYTRTTWLPMGLPTPASSRGLFRTSKLTSKVRLRHSRPHFEAFAILCSKWPVS
jgi:hypothetical protein